MCEGINTSLQSAQLTAGGVCVCLCVCVWGGGGWGGGGVFSFNDFRGGEGEGGVGEKINEDQGGQGA